MTISDFVSLVLKVEGKLHIILHSDVLSLNFLCHETLVHKTHSLLCKLKQVIENILLVFCFNVTKDFKLTHCLTFKLSIILANNRKYNCTYWWLTINWTPASVDFVMQVQTHPRSAKEPTINFPVLSNR